MTAPTMMPMQDPEIYRKKSALASAAFNPTAGVKQTQIDPANDLRSKQITPGYDPRLANASGQADKAAGAVSNWGGYTPFQGVGTNDSYTSGAAGYTQQAAQAGNTGPIAGTNLGAARGYLNQAAGAAGGGVSGGGPIQAGQVGAGQPVAYGGPSAINYGKDTEALRAGLTSQLQGMTTAPNRSSLAAQAFKLMQDQQAPAREQGFRQVNQKAAAMGRQGAGMTTNDLTGLEQDYTRQDNLTKRDLALQAAGQELDDRLNVSGATQSGLGALSGLDSNQAQFGADAARTRMSADQYNNDDRFKRDAFNIGNNLDTARFNSDNQFRTSSANADAGFRRADLMRGIAGDEAGFASTTRRDAESDRGYGLEKGRFLSGLSDQAFGQGRDLRNEARGERSDRTALETADLNAKRGIFGDLSDREGQIFRQGESTRNEFRGERDFQAGQAQQGIDNAFKQRALEETILGNQTNRDADELDQMDRLGNGYDPTRTYQGIGDDYQGQSDSAWDGVGSALGGLGYGSGLGGPQAPPSVTGALDVLDYGPPKIKNNSWYNGGR